MALFYALFGGVLLRESATSRLLITVYVLVTLRLISVVLINKCISINIFHHLYMAKDLAFYGPHTYTAVTYQRNTSACCHSAKALVM